jgi:tetratricopeptide (TPR) repeat protein
MRSLGTAFILLALGCGASARTPAAQPPAADRPGREAPAEAPAAEMPVVSEQDLAAVSPAQTLFEAAQYDQALEAITNERNDHPTGQETAYLAGLIHLRKNQSDRAKEEFSRLLQDADEVWRLIGESAVALASSQLDPAIDKANEASSKAREGMVPADQLASLSPDRKAEEASKRPKRFHADYQLGLVKSRREDWAGAAEALDRATMVNPAFAYAHYYAGVAYSRIQRADKVASHFELFLKLAPKAPERSAVMSIMRTLRGN